MALGARIRYYRNKAGLTLDQLSELSGVEMGTISALEVRDSTRSAYARKIASALGLTVDELEDESADHDVGPAKTAPLRAAEPEPPYLELPGDGNEAGELVITQYQDIGGAMGHGFNLTDNPPGHIRSWRVTPEWLRLNVPNHTGVKNLSIVTGFGPSMKPMFNPGDPLLVDTGIRVIDHEGVYFFRVGDEGFIKIIQRVPQFDGPGIILRVISKNPDYPPYDLSPKNPHFEVLGKVLTVWRSEQY